MSPYEPLFYYPLAWALPSLALVQQVEEVEVVVEQQQFSEQQLSSAQGFL
jgi:hypothetical protein